MISTARRFPNPNGAFFYFFQLSASTNHLERIRGHFECEQGYALHKEAKSIFCGEEGAWSYPPSTGCKRKLKVRVLTQKNF